MGERIQWKAGLALALLAMVIGTGCSSGSEGQLERPTDPASFGESHADYIVSHSTSGVSRLGPIVVETQQPLPESLPEGVVVVNDGKVAGSLVRRSQYAIEFKPSSPMQSGASYTVRVEPTKLGLTSKEPLSFSVDIREMDAVIEIERNAPNPETGKVEIAGYVRTSDSASDGDIEAALSIEGAKGNPVISWEHSGGTQHAFVIREVVREDEDYALLLALNGAGFGGQDTREERVIINGRLNFLVRDVRLIRGERPFVEVYFSDLVDDKVELAGLIRVMTGSKEVPTRLDRDDNVVRIYPKTSWPAQAKLVIDAAVKSVANRSLKGSVERDLYLRQSRPPHVRFTTEGTISSDPKAPTLAFETAGLRAIRVEATRVNRERLGQFLQVNDWSGSQEMNRVGYRVFTKHYKLEAGNTPSGWDRHVLDLRALVGEDPKGLYRLKVSFDTRHLKQSCDGTRVTVAELNAWEEAQTYNDRPVESSFWDMYGGQGDWYTGYRNRGNPCHWGYYQHNKQKSETSKNYILSQHGIIAKAGTNGELFVAVTTLDDAQPAAGVKVRVTDYQQSVIGEALTDSNGMVVLTPRGKPYVVETSRGDAFGILRISNGDSLVYSHFEIAGAKSQRGLKGLVFGERDVWRPGDTLYLTGMVFDIHGKLPFDAPATLWVKSPSGDKVYNETRASSVNGFYHWPVPTESNWQTGFYTATLRVGNAEFSRPIRIEMIKPNRIEVNLELPEGELTGMEPLLEAPLSAAWLHGAPASELEADIGVMLTSRPTRFSKYSDYHFDDITRNYSFSFERSDTFLLDKAGKTEVSVPFNVGQRPPGKLKATFSTRVFEESGGFSISSSSMNLSPFQSYVGVKTPKGDAARGMLLTDQDHPVDIALVDKDGEPVKSGEVEVSFYKVGWKWWWEKGYGDLADYTGRRSVNLLSKAKLPIEAGKAAWTIRQNYPSWGRYLLVARDIAGGHQTSKVIYMDWPGWAGKARKDSPGGANVLSLITDKKKYSVGDTVQLTIPSRGGANLLVSVERGESRVKSEWVQATGDRTLYSFKVEPSMAPGVYLNVTQVVPTGDWQPAEPLRMYGVVPIDVIDPGTVLEPVIAAPQEVEPNSDVTIEVSEKSGRAMTYMLALVDEGLLNLTQFKTPNAHGQFYRRESFAMRNWDTYGDIIGASGFRFGSQLAVGGGEDGEDESSRRENRFPSLIDVQGPFELGAKSTEKHTVSIPSYLGKGRWMVVAGNVREGRFGQAESSMVIKKSLMALTTLPRLVGAGEEFFVPVTVFVDEKGVGDVTLDLRLSDGLRSSSGGKARLKFTKPGQQTATFRVMAGEEPGFTKVEVVARGQGLESVASTNLEVRPATPWSNMILTQMIEPGKTWEPSLTNDFMGTDLRAAVELSRLGNLGLENRLDELVRYPHGCLEQTVSKSFPQLYLSQLVDLAPESAQRIRDHIDEAMRKMNNFQSSNGGYGYWPVGGNPHPFGSVYAGHFMLEAERLGYYWEPSRKEKFVDAERRNAQLFGSVEDHRASFLQAYRLYVLALAGSPEFGAMNRMKSVGSKGLAGLYLSAAYLKAGETSIARSLFEGAIKDKAVRYGDESDGNFHSAVRDQALVLELFALFGDKRAEGVAKALQEVLKSSRSLNTQESSQILRTLAGYLQSKGGSGVKAVVVSNQGRVELASDKLSAQRSFSKLTKLAIENKDTAPVYATLRLGGYLKPSKSKKMNRGLAVNVSYRSFDNGSVLDPSRLMQGTDFAIDVKVTNQSGKLIKNIALTHLVPSGWEILDRPLKAKIAGVDLKDIRDDRVLTYFALPPGKTKSFRVRAHAAYQGLYYLPSVRAEAMYDASAFGQSAADFVEVLKPSDAF